MERADSEPVRDLYESARSELHAYLCRLVIRPQVAEDLVQAAFVRALEHRDAMPLEAGAARAWLFKVATHLAFDALRRHSTWRETPMPELREAAESNPEFVSRSLDLVGTPESKAIAREHLAACFACTLRNLPERKAATLLLREVHGFSLEEISAMLECTPAQAKNWLQEARGYMTARYAQTCALVAKQGVCYQCVELDGFFRAAQGNPLAAGEGIDARLREVVSLRDRPWGRWHRMLFSILDEIA